MDRRPRAAGGIGIPAQVAGRVRLCALAAGAVLAALAAAAPVRADGEHVERLAVEVAVMAADARARTDAATPPLHRQGLAERIRGGLATLPLLIRLARQENPRLAAPPPDAATELRAALDGGDDGVLAEGLARLAVLYPFDSTGILPADATPARLARAEAIHAELCAGCHDAPDLEVARPAFNLFERARRLDEREFAARIVAGVRGDGLTSLQNPLTRADVAALIAYYRERSPAE